MRVRFPYPASAFYAMDDTFILGLILVNLLMFYPWQRRLYLRSQREFGLKQQSIP
jgi:hypothetical protein